MTTPSTRYSWVYPCVLISVLIVSARSAQAIPNPTAFTLTPGLRSITLNVTNTSDPGYISTMVVRSQNTISWSPTAGTYYAVGSEVASGVFVIVNEFGFNSRVDYPLVPGTRYYYKAYTVGQGYSYSSGLARDAVPTGTPPAIADPADVHAEPGTSRVTLTWTNPTDPAYASTLLVRFTSNELWWPTQGAAYQPGQAAGGGIVVCNAALTRFVDTGLKNGQQYWYRVFAVTSGLGYSFGVAVTATPYKEPTSHYYEFAREWGAPGSGPGQFDATWGPKGLAIVNAEGSASEVHVSDPGNHRVQIFSTEGQYISNTRYWNDDNRFWRDDLAFSPSLTEYVMSVGRQCGVSGPYGGTQICRYHRTAYEGSCTFEVYPQPSYASICDTTIPLTYGVPAAMAAVVTDDNKVWLFTPPHGDFRSWGSPGTGDGQLSGPTSIVQGKPDAYLYVGDQTGRIQKFLFNGTFVQKMTFPGGDRLSEVPLDMAVDQWGCFYVATSGFKILKFDKSWNFLTGWGRKGTGPGEFGESSEHTSRLRIAVDDSDRVYVSDAVNCRVQVFQESDRNGTDIHYNAFVAEPVNTATGNFSYEHTDLTIPGRGMGLMFARSYNSQSEYEAALGPGWRHSYDTSLPPKVDGARVMCWGDGRETTYQPEPGNPNNYLPVSVGVYDTLVKNGDNTFTLTTAQAQVRYNFNTDGRLTTVVDKNGNTQTLAYNALGRLTTITDSAGRATSLTYGANGKLARVTDALARQVNYAYTTAGELASVTDPCGNTTQYTYDANHQMLTVVDPRGHAVITNTYDGYRRVEQQVNARGAVTRFEYLTETISTPYGDIHVYKGITRVTEGYGTPFARTSEHHYDPQGRLVKIIHPDSLTTEYAYDASNNRTSVKDRRSNTTTYTFDTRGNMLTKTDAKGGTTPISYDARNNPLSRTDPTSRTTTYQYDAAGNLTKSIDPLAHETMMTYDAYGQLASTTDAEGRTQTLVYDANGDVTSKTDARGKVWTYTYDAVGRKLTEADPTTATTRYQYDNCDRVTWITDALNQDSTFAYDANGNKTSETLPGARSLTYTYNENDHLLTATDARGNTSQYEYDILDRKKKTRNSLAGETLYEYDPLDRLVKQTDANGHFWQYTYDGNGNRLTAKDPCLKTWSYTYDELDRQITAKDPLNYTTTTAYDAAGRITSITNPAGSTMSYQYDGAGRKTHETDYRGNTTQFGYDDVGNLISVTDPLGHVTQHAYDGNNSRISTTNALGQVTTFAYDEVNRLARTADALGNVTSNGYDALGRLSDVTDANGHAYVYQYDPAGNLTRVTEPTEGVTEYTYDKNGNMLRFTNARGKITSYTYDALNRKTSETNPLNLMHSFAYDAVGNLTRMTDENVQDTTYVYDACDRLTSVRYPGGPTVTYQYDDAGRRIQMTDGIGTSMYTYDCCGHRLSYQDPFGKTIGYAYDANGNRTILTYPDAKQVTYAYDAANRMTNVTDWDSRVTTYTYDNANRVTRNTLPNGTYCDYGYDAAGRLTSRVNKKPDASLIAGYMLTLDPAGNRTRIDTKGALQASPENEDVTYEYDGANRITRANDTTFAFSNRGNMIRKTEPGSVVTEYTHDGRDRLVGITAPGTNFSARYDGAGNRLETTDAGTLQRAVIDDAAPLSQLLCRTDSAGTLQTHCVYGPAGTLLYEVPVPTPVRFFHFDYVGSTATLTGDVATVTDQYAYDEFGNILQKQGMSENLFRYAGAFGVVGNPGDLCLMRARHYVPALGLFTATDPKPGDWRIPLTLNPYLYASASPVSQTDPTGEFPFVIVPIVVIVVYAALIGGQINVNWQPTKEVVGSGHRGLETTQETIKGCQNTGDFEPCRGLYGQTISGEIWDANTGPPPKDTNTTVTAQTTKVIFPVKAASGPVRAYAQSVITTDESAIVRRAATIGGGHASSRVFQSSSTVVPAAVTPETYEPKYRPINKVRAKDMR